MEQHPYQQQIDNLRAHLADAGNGSSLRQASEADLQWLRDQSVTEEIVAFFAIAEPSRWLYIKGIEIGPVSGLKDANTMAVPGVAASRYGYLVIARTVSGDAYCLDLNQVGDDGQVPVYILNHEKVWEGASRQAVEAERRLVTTSFSEFLTRFIAADLPYDFHDA